MKKLRYVLAILMNIIQLYIIILIFVKVNDGFESIVVSLLILIYISINSYFITNGYIESNKMIGLVKELINIKILLKDKKLLNLYENEEDIYNDYLEEPKKALEKNLPKFYINGIFNFIFYLVCILNILRVIMN